MAAVLLVVVLLPMVSALLASLRLITAATAARGSAVAAAASAAGAAVLLAGVATGVPVSAVWTTGSGSLLAGVSVDRLTGLLLLLVCVVNALVQGFAVRYLAADPRLRWFVASSGLLAAASAGVMTAVTLVGLAVCWSTAGLALWMLLGTYPGLPAARQGRRRAAVAFLGGDILLWTAVGIVTARWGTIDVRSLGADALPGGEHVLPGLACLVVLAALTRSAQVPFQSWLPATLAAPTPVSALLHAGVINAGGVLLVRLSPIAGSSRLALGLTVAAGAVSAVYGTALMLTKPDVKGALAHSTMGQMGFMIVSCGLGMYAAAVIHLVAHGLYKATLFLAAGGAVHRHVEHNAAPPAPRLSARRRRSVSASALVLPGMVLLGAVRLIQPTLGGQAGAGALLLFAWAAAAAASLGWLRHRPTLLGLTIAIVALGAGVCAYVAGVDAIDRFLAPVLTASVAVPSPGWWLLVTFTVLCLLTALSRSAFSAGTGTVGSFHRRMYVLALTAGHVRLPRLPMSARLQHVSPTAVPMQASAQPMKVHS